MLNMLGELMKFDQSEKRVIPLPFLVQEILVLIITVLLFV